MRCGRRSESNSLNVKSFGLNLIRSAHRDAALRHAQQSTNLDVVPPNRDDHSMHR